MSNGRCKHGHLLQDGLMAVQVRPMPSPGWHPGPRGLRRRDSLLCVPASTFMTCHPSTTAACWSTEASRLLLSHDPPGQSSPLSLVRSPSSLPNAHLPECHQAASTVGHELMVHALNGQPLAVIRAGTLRPDAAHTVNSDVGGVQGILSASSRCMYTFLLIRADSNVSPNA